MTGRRLFYLAALEVCLVFWLAYREWAAWVLLIAVAALPWFALLVSLPAMLTARHTLACPARLTAGGAALPQLHIACPLPAPPARCRLSVRHNFSGRAFFCQEGDSISARHCGTLEISVHRLWIHDYLGLIRLRRGKGEVHTVTVFPKPISIKDLTLPEECQNGILVPKPGGFSEIHDLRLYRPGDDLRQIHWKLAAKTGKLIYREPMLHRAPERLLDLCLSGTPQALDRKLGRLYWLSLQLLEKEMPHRIRCITGRGTEEYRVADRQQLDEAMTALLVAPLAQKEQLPQPMGAHWRYGIGGEPDET